MAPLVAGGGALVGVATWLVLDGRGGQAGWAAAGAGALILAGSALGRLHPRAPGQMLVSFADRAFEGCVFAAIAWEARAGDPAISAAALVALSAGFLAAYVRARGESLGYRIDESLGWRGLRYGVISLGLVTGWLAGAVYAAAALAILTALVRTSQVVKEERA